MSRRLSLSLFLIVTVAIVASTGSWLPARAQSDQAAAPATRDGKFVDARACASVRVQGHDLRPAARPGAGEEFCFASLPQQA